MGYYLSHKTNDILIFHSYEWTSKAYDKWKKVDPEGHVFCDSIYTKCEELMGAS